MKTLSETEMSEVMGGSRCNTGCNIAGSILVGISIGAAGLSFGASLVAGAFGSVIWGQAVCGTICG